MPHGSTRKRQLLIVAVIGLAGVACVDEKVVFRDRELFTEPPAGAANFIGYTDADSKLTVCGNCHVNNQTEWEGTAHADAFATLVASGHAQASCEGCHSVGSRGNPASGQAGWDATRDDRYKDVQCESCHGPGLTHVSNPLATNIPLAPLAVDTGLTRGCGECHNGTHHPFVQEWRQSGHARVQTSPAGNPSCNYCHTAENVLLDWGVRSNYAEKDSVTSNATAHLPIVCSVCHDPHATNDNAGQLRFPIDVPSESGNLCMKCHHKRGVHDPTTFRGPHSPEGPVLLGYGGWWPPSMEFPSDTIKATHGSDRNPRLCAGCHIHPFTVNDPQTGNFAFQVTGHLFEAIPCLNAQGIPVPGDCALSQRTFRSCAGTGCHTEASARSAYVTVQGRLELLTETLEDLWRQIPASEFVNDGRYTTGEGAKFNWHLAHPDSFPGSGIHNPFLIEALVTSSIKQIELDYGISAPAALNVDGILKRLGIRQIQK